MRSYSTYILIASAALLTAIGCNKAPQPSYVLTDSPIMLSATEAETDAPFRKGSTPATKAMLDEDTFAAAGNQIQIYDIYTQAGSNTPDENPYIADQIKSPGPGSYTWPFVEKRYNWTTDGTHKFFGWLAKDVNMGNMTPEDFFGNDFAFSNQVLTTGTKTINASTEFDFMYSNVHVRDLNTNPDFASAVPLEFAHLFTAFSVAAQNISDKVKITIVSLEIEGLMNKRGAKLNYTNTADTKYPTITYTSLSNDDSEVADYKYEPNYQLNKSLIDMDTKSTDRSYFMSWPMSTEEAANVTLTIKYRVNDGTEVLSKDIPLTGKEWAAGKKNNVNLTFTDKTITLDCQVVDWTWEQQEIDFTDVISVSQTMQNKWENVSSVNYTTGEVILKQSTSQEASVKFQIDSPRGATWTASLIMIEGATDAIQIVDGYKYGKVGEPGEIRLKVAKDTPIENRNTFYLRVTVQTADGNTIIATGLTGSNAYEEFTIIQNLIN